MWSSRRLLALFATALLMSASAVACGPSSQPAPAPAGGQPGASAPAPGAPSAPAAAAIPGPGGQGTPKRGGIWRTTIVADAGTFDVHATSLNYTTDITHRTHNRLTRYEYNDKPGSMVVVGDLAEKWEVSTDAKTWTFTLRKGVKFHNLPPMNGRELVADDIKYSYERIKTAPTSVWKGQYDFIDRIEVVDKYTVRFALKVAYASMLYRTSDGEAAWIVAKEVAGSSDYGKDPHKSMIGTGPFIFDKYDRGVAHSQKRNPDYFGSGFPGTPYIDEVEQLIMADAGARLAAFVSKQIDVLSVPRADLERVRAALPGVQIRTGAGSASSNGMSVNVTKPPFDNVKVRQAVKYGVSQQNLIDGLFKGDGQWHGYIGTVGTVWALPESEVKQLWRHDPELSKKLLAEAGFPNGFKTEILVYREQQNYIDIAEVWKADLAKVGIDVTIKIDAAAAGRLATEQGNYVLHLGPHVTALEPDEVVADGLVPGGSRNFSRLNDPIINDLAAKQAVIVNVQERKKVVDEVSRRVAEIVPLVPTPNVISYRAGQAYLKNWIPQTSDECDEQFFWIEK